MLGLSSCSAYAEHSIQKIDIILNIYLVQNPPSILFDVIQLYLKKLFN